MFRTSTLAALAASVIVTAIAPSHAMSPAFMPAAQPFDEATPSSRLPHKHYIWCMTKYGQDYNPRTDIVTYYDRKGNVVRQRRCRSLYSR